MLKKDIVESNACVGNKIVTVGDYVSFKSGYEQTGRIVKITRNIFGRMLTLYNADGFDNDNVYTKVYTNECWID